MTLSSYEFKKSKCKIIGRVRGPECSYKVNKSLLKKYIGGTPSCQDKINKQMDGHFDWLTMLKPLQNLDGKAILTALGNINNKHIVVKAQLYNEYQHEDSIQNKLHEYNLNGFIKFTCTFTCQKDDVKNYIETFKHYVRGGQICKQKGIGMGVIIMPYHVNGSFESYLTNSQSTKERIKKITKQVIKNMFDAYDKHGFNHGDLFTKNIVLDKNYNATIIDFEKSTFDKDLNRYWLDIDNFINDIIRRIKPNISNINEFNIFIRQYIVMNSAFGKEPTKEMINELIKELMKLF